jgi:hypothetical protein
MATPWENPAKTIGAAGGMSIDASAAFTYAMLSAMRVSRSCRTIQLETTASVRPL